jgi:hypothetical protein
MVVPCPEYQHFPESEHAEFFQDTLNNVFAIFQLSKLHFPKVFPKFSKNGTLWAEWSGHSEYTTLEHFGPIVPMHFEFYWLSKLWLLHWGHCKEHFERTTQEHHGNILWEHLEFSHIFPN